MNQNIVQNTTTHSKHNNTLQTQQHTQNTTPHSKHNNTLKTQQHTQNTTTHSKGCIHIMETWNKNHNKTKTVIYHICTYLGSTFDGLVIIR